MTKSRASKGTPEKASRGASKVTPRGASKRPVKNTPNKTSTKVALKAESQDKVQARQQPPHVQPVEIYIPASTEYVRVARLAVTGVASRMNFSYEDIEDIKLAISEACNNAILHACPPLTDKSSAQVSLDQTLTIRVTVTAHPDRLEISVTDEGRTETNRLHKAAKRALSARERVASELPESGFGLLLIQSLMDKIEQESDGISHTTIRMTKYLHGRRSSPPLD